MADHEEVMARARAYVVGRQDERAAEERERRAAEIMGMSVVAWRDHVHATLDRMLLGLDVATGDVIVVDDEWSQLALAAAGQGWRQRKADGVIAGIVGSGKGSAWWGVPVKSGSEMAPQKSGIEMPHWLGGAEVVRVSGGYVSDDEVRDVAAMPVTWAYDVPAMPRYPRWWLLVRYPWSSLLGWWHGRRWR